MASRSEPAVRDAEQADVAAIRRFGEAHIRPHYAPLIGAEAADAQVRRWWNETHVGAAVAEGLVVVAEADGQIVGVGQRRRRGADQDTRDARMRIGLRDVLRADARPEPLCAHVPRLGVVGHGLDDR